MLKYIDLTIEDKKKIIEIWYDEKGFKLEKVNSICALYKIKNRTVYNWVKNIKNESVDSNIKNEVENNGQFIKGTSTLYDEKGNRKLRWVKTDINNETLLQSMKLAIEELIKEVQPINEIKLNETIINDKDLLTFYPLPDLHFGLLVSKEESNHGYNYDLKIARKWVLESMKYLVKTSPNSQKALIVDLGDFLHSSDNNNRTKSGHVLDVDGRHYRIVKTAYEVTQMLIEEALKKHNEVIFYSIPGNHSDLAGIGLKSYLSAYYKDNPRVKIVDEHKSQQYYPFGKSIIGFSHGHELRPERASEVMVYDNQEIFSDSLYRYYHFGHFHSNKMFESPLCKVEIHKNIIPRDSWAEGMGFRGNIGEAKSITYHCTFGEISRNTFNIKMIEN